MNTSSWRGTWLSTRIDNFAFKDRIVGECDAVLNAHVPTEELERVFVYPITSRIMKLVMIMGLEEYASHVRKSMCQEYSVLKSQHCNTLSF